MTVNPTNDFNAISLIPLGQLTAAQQNILMAMARNGVSIVNPLGDVRDFDGRTPESRARKEREELEQYRQTIAQLEQGRIEFQHDLDRREQACAEALRENEEQLREAQLQLQNIRDRAYEITLSDCKLAKVYRDGDKVRVESGAEVSREVVKAEDLGSQQPTWSEFKGFGNRVDGLLQEHNAIIDYQRKIAEFRGTGPGGDIALDDLRRDLDKVRPQSVAVKESELQSSPQAPNNEPTPRDMQKLSERFAAADQGRSTAYPPVLSDADFETIRKTPSVSAPAAK